MMKTIKKTLALGIAAFMLFSTATQSFATENTDVGMENNQVLEDIINPDLTLDEEILPTAGGCANWSVDRVGTPYCDLPVCGNPFSGNPTNFQTQYMKRKCIDSNGNVYTEKKEVVTKLGCC